MYIYEKPDKTFQNIFKEAVDIFSQALTNAFLCDWPDRKHHHQPIPEAILDKLHLLLPCHRTIPPYA